MMTSHWTAEQVLALAPDASAARAGKDLALAGKWLAVGRNASAVWGEMKGSAAVPYQAQIDLTEPAFRCSCPSRKFPCKHALGLFLLLVLNPPAFEEKTPPPWVTAWLEGRARRQAKSGSRAEIPQNVPPEAIISEGPTTGAPAEVQAEAPATAARRTGSATAVRREQRVAGGVADLARWLEDLLRPGLAQLQAQPLSFWEAAAARLVDAQAPGLARKVRRLAEVPSSGPGWEGRLLERLGKLYLLVEAYPRLAQLPADLQAEVRTQIGWNQTQEDANGNQGVRDRWLVVGQRVEEELAGGLKNSATLRTQRTWLWGQSTHQAALVLSFAAPGQTLDLSLQAGTGLEAEVVYYPGAYPLRALARQRFGAPTAWATVLDHSGTGGCSSFIDATAAYAAALSQNPWLERFPLVLEQILPVYQDGAWQIVDMQQYHLPLAPKFGNGWALLAFSGGVPLTVFGEWDGDYFFPFSTWNGERWVAL